MKNSGFTLIELSIVLVIIGLIIGGILVGRDLINAAAARAQISQIEKYSSAVNTFSNKYGGLPGDLSVALANQFGFTAGNGTIGQSNGNGLIEGTSTGSFMGVDCCEAAMFWTHLGGAGLIDGEFSAAVWSTGISTGQATVFPLYFPTAKVGNNNYVYVYTYGGVNWFGVSGISNFWGAGNITITWAMTPLTAYNIDKKIDDGLPTTGTVLAVYPASTGNGQTPATNNPTDTNSTCYNTAGQGGYSVSTTANGGNNLTCALSFRFE